MTNCEKFAHAMSESIAEAMDKKLYAYPYGKSEIPMVVNLFIAMLKTQSPNAIDPRTMEPMELGPMGEAVAEKCGIAPTWKAVVVYLNEGSSQ